MNEKKRTVTLTIEEWNELTCYILMTTKYREGEKEAWERLSEEKDADGNPTFPNAKENIEFWKNMINKLGNMRNEIDRQVWGG